MIDPKDYPFHLKELGGEEEFKEYIQLWKKDAPWSDDEHIKNILNGEEEAKVSISMWCNPWM